MKYTTAESVQYFDLKICGRQPKYSEIIPIAVSVILKNAFCFPENEPAPPKLESGNDPPGL
jgi:hypothetical protein